MFDFEQRFGKASESGLAPGDLAWVQRVDPARISAVQAGRLRAMKGRASANERSLIDEVLADYREANHRPEPDEGVSAARAEAMARGRAHGKAEREARMEEAAAQREPTDLLRGMYLLGGEKIGDD